MQSKIYALILSSLMALTFVIGCESANSSNDTRKNFKNISLALDWYPWSNHVGLFVAKEKGYYKDNNLDISIYTPSDPSSILQTVGSGKDDFGISYQTDVILAQAEGIPVTSVFAIVQLPLNSIITLKSSGINRPKDLEGKKVGYPGIPTEELLLNTVVEYDGGNIQKVELINVGYDLVKALISKKVDAIIGAYWVHESFIIEKQGLKVNVLKIEDWGVPDFYELVIVTNENTVKNNPELIREFLDSTVKGYQYSIENPEAGINIMKNSNPEIDTELETAGIKLLLPLWNEKDILFGWQDKTRWKNLASWMLDKKLINNPVDLDKTFTNQFVEN